MATYFNETHRIFRNTVRQFVEREIKPFVFEWEESHHVPDELYTKAAHEGLLGLGFETKYGGTESDIFHLLVAVEELVRAGSQGVVANLFSHMIGLPPIQFMGNEEQKERFIRPVLSGQKKSALGITEPNVGSDVANIQTRAIRQGDNYIVNGSKTYITGGCRADFLTAAVRTGGLGYEGISLLVIEKENPGYKVENNLKKMGWWASDTAEISFTDCKVPVKNLLGQENNGFMGIINNFQRERLFLSAMAYASAQLALDLSIEHANHRSVFGKPLIAKQVIRHKLADMATKIDIAREYIYRIADRIRSNETVIKEVAMAKNFAVETAEFVSREAVQIHGGMGYMRECPVERIYRDTKLLSIGGGTDEIMKEIIIKCMGWGQNQA